VTRDVPPGGLAVGMPARIRRAKNDAQPTAAPSGTDSTEANTASAAGSSDTDTTSSRGGASSATERDVKE
jgi:hypothetical protein